MKRVPVLLLIAVLALPASALAAKKDAAAKADEPKATLLADTLAGLKLRTIGPAINSGRVSDFAVTPGARHRYFVAVASGGVWKTENAGTTWTPVFDTEGSYSIGCIAMDPRNHNVLWVGTGENNSQRSVSFGDGVYRSLDGGQTWTNVGLEDSEHIGRIAIDPRDSNVVWVAAQGPLWKAGGERGLYKTTDGGATWQRVLHISDDTGVNEVWLDPREPDTVYATAYQRRRHVWSLLHGGPESALHKSTDGGVTWRKITKGLPKVELGRIGLVVSPVDPDVLYAIVEAQRDEGGFYRSTDRGESWTKQSDYMSQSPQYYNELVADPHDVDTIYSMDTFLHVSNDAGKTFRRVGEKTKHVDNHAMWIDPDDPDYILVGCDGGVYESFDRGTKWLFKENLPITQFYRVTVDTSKPFYMVYGGTQDNNSLGGPSRTLRRSGISNEDWFITVGGDGYETRVDPTDPNILYSQWQYGGLVRYDRRSEEIVDIQPQEEPGEPAHRWNWDSPLIISPHSPTRLYYACQRLFRSDDRGDTWKAVSPDLSRQLDRDRLPIMGTLWSMDAVAKNQSTSDYGNIVSLDESTLVEGLVYVGTDDGLVQVTEDGGATWRRVESFAGVPERTYVSDLEASRHDPDTVYATFDNHKMGDFTPYLAVSRDRGRTWSSIRGDMPDREIAYTLAQDHVEPGLLFAGTEFGVWATVDEGAHWHKLKGGIPTIQVRDLDIQREWNDLAVATFGRGFWILDDYTPLRGLSEQKLAGSEAILFPTREALQYAVQPSRIESRGDAFWTVDNPPYGAVFTYWLRDGLKTRSELRIEAEKKAAEAKQDPPLPSMAELRAEDLEVPPEVMLVVRDLDGAVVRRVAAEREAGMHRVAWDLRLPSVAPAQLEERKTPDWGQPEVGPMALPGTYRATLEAAVAGEVRTLAGPVEVEVVPLALATLGAQDRAAVMSFAGEVRELRRAVLGASDFAEDVGDRIALVRRALVDTPAAQADMVAAVEDLQTRFDALLLELEGDETKGKRNVFAPPAIVERVERIASDQWWHTQAPTATHRQALEWASEAFAAQLEALESLVRDLAALEARADAAGAPWTPGRFPVWKR